MSDIKSNIEIHSVKEGLDKEGFILSEVKGVSMLPTLRENRDRVIIEVPKGELQKGDLVLYIRFDGAYVLHRIIEVGANEYLIRGDNTYVNEHVPKENVIGIVTHILQGEKVLDMSDPAYQTYVANLNRTYPFRKKLWQLRKSISQVLSKKGRHKME